MELSKHPEDKINKGRKKQEQILKMLKTDDQEYESVKELKYLGTIITEGNDVTADTKHRIIMANGTGYV